MNPRYERNIPALTEAECDILRGMRVLVVGCGGLGGHLIELLARVGIGALRVVDGDVFEASNLNRQLCALHSTLGRFKSDVMAERILDINPDCRVKSVPEHYCEETKERFFSQSCDYIVDAIDLVSCKLSLIQTAQERSIPIISSMGTGNKLDPMRFCITDISKTSGCHLARIMRRELRNRGIYHQTVLYSEELPQTSQQLQAPPPGRRSIPASVSWVPSCAGLMLAGYVVQELIKNAK